jgi:hypothetical protein
VNGEKTLFNEVQENRWIFLNLEEGRGRVTHLEAREDGRGSRTVWSHILIPSNGFKEKDTEGEDVGSLVPLFVRHLRCHPGHKLKGGLRGAQQVSGGNGLVGKDG